MSMILDALSRAEQERKESTEGAFNASRYTNSAAAQDDKVKRWILLALIINICLLSVFAVFYLWKTSEPQEVMKEISKPTSSPVPAAVVEEIEEVKIDIEPPVPEPVEKPSKVLEPKPIVQQQSSLEEEALVQRERVMSKAEAIGASTSSKPKVTIASEPLVSDEPQIPQPVVPSQPETNSQYLSISDLSGADKSKLSSYEINVHVYDNAIEDRFVLVNMQKYKEGDRLPGGGPIISEITPEGLVMELSQGKVLLERN